MCPGLTACITYIVKHAHKCKLETQCQARSTYEFLDNETVRYSGAHLRHLGADAAAEKAAREEEAHAAADKKEVDADAQEAADQEQKPQLQLLDTKQQKDALLLQLQQQHALKSCCAFDKVFAHAEIIQFAVSSTQTDKPTHILRNCFGSLSVCIGKKCFPHGYMPIFT